jgi:hypothetical protein
MSKQFKKFRKNDYYEDDSENFVIRSNYLERKNEKRVDRALKTKDITALLEQEEDITDYPYNNIYDEMDDEYLPEEDERR